MTSLADRVVVVTGAAHGIGAATAQLLREYGARVVGVDRDPCPAATRWVAADLADAAQVEQVLPGVVDSVGGVDALVNNAGLARHAPLVDLDAADLDLMWRVNAAATILLTRDALRLMAPGGRVVNVISTAGLVGQPGEAAYCATKAAVRGFTEAAAEEGRVRGVHVSGLYPAGVGTGFWDAAVADPAGFAAGKTWLDPAQVAAQVLALLTLPDGVEVPALVVRHAGDVAADAVHAKLAAVRR